MAIATNATYLKSVERWAMSKRIPTARIVNTGLAGVRCDLCAGLSLRRVLAPPSLDCYGGRVIVLLL